MAKYSYADILKKIEANKADGFISLESELDIDKEVGKRLEEEGYELLAFPTSPDSWGLKIIWSQMAMKRYYKKDSPITYGVLEAILRDLRLVSPIVLENVIYKTRDK